MAVEHTIHAWQRSAAAAAENMKSNTERKIRQWRQQDIHDNYWNKLSVRWALFIYGSMKKKTTSWNNERAEHLKSSSN